MRSITGLINLEVDEKEFEETDSGFWTLYRELLPDGPRTIYRVMRELSLWIREREWFRWLLFENQWWHQMFCDPTYKLDPRCLVYLPNTVKQYQDSPFDVDTIKRSY